MYCPHGRCKTKAYRSRKKESAQKDATKRDADPSTSSTKSPAPLLLTEVLQQAYASAPNAPQMFSHALACTCGQRFTVQIWVSHDPTTAQKLPELSPKAASQVVMEAASATLAEPALATPSPIETRAEGPMMSMSPVLELDSSMAQPASAEQLPMAPESSVVAAAAPIFSHEPPAETSPAGEGEGDLLDPAISLVWTKSKNDRPEAVAQTSPECSVNVRDVDPSSEPLDPGRGTSTPSASGVSASPPQSSAPRTVGSLGGGFWQQVKENPAQAMETFYRLLESGHSKNDHALVERAHCGLALVYALRGDGPHASERLQHAHKAAMKRGNTEEVEKAVEIVDQILTAANLRR